ncbi:MAG TPA: hypothetical protein VHO03_01240 [Ignavibacteriales bacterium]|nr:hypothetical protein [Ignavibacteriales bacterium]
MKIARLSAKKALKAATVSCRIEGYKEPRDRSKKVKAREIAIRK